jgi:hypothetical protein
MPGVAGYLKKVREVIDSTPYVLSRSLEFEDRGGIALILRGKLVFDDLSELHIREYALFLGKAVKIAYSYHYQDKKANLIFRYDNAEHHPEVETYPHHKHIPEGSPISSREVNLDEVILEVCNQLMKKKD